MMTDAGFPSLETEFARWYRTVDLRLDPSCRQNRWNGVVAFAEDANQDDIEALIRLAFRTQQAATTSTMQRILQAFKTADGAFDIQDNERELEVLAATCLAVLMADGKDVGATAALAITTTELGGGRKPDVPMNLCALAESAIECSADANRRRPTLGDYGFSEPPKIDFKKATAKIRETQNWDGVSNAFNSAASAVRTAMAEMAQRQADTILAIDQFVRIQDEELQMLWWLTGQRSWDYDCPFGEVKAAVQPLVFAKELADSTEFQPGPPSVKGLLSLAGLKEREKVTIPAVINAAEPEWLQKVVGEEDPSPVSTPLHFAIKRQLETGAGEAWVPGWEGVTGVSEGHKISPLLLGVLFYRERLLRMFE